MLYGKELYRYLSVDSHIFEGLKSQRNRVCLRKNGGGQADKPQDALGLWKDKDKYRQIIRT